MWGVLVEGDDALRPVNLDVSTSYSQFRFLDSFRNRCRYVSRVHDGMCSNDICEGADEVANVTGASSACRCIYI